MKISCEREALLRQLQTVSRVASTRSAIQALSGVQLIAASSGCELQATDMDVGLRVPLEADVVREGIVVLPARLLLDVVRLLPAEQRLARAARRRAGRRTRLRKRDVPHPDAPSRGLSAIPRAPGADGVVSLPVEAFVATALKVANSASRDETRPVLTGILVSASDRELRMVATDSYRLSVKETTLEDALAVWLRGQRAGARAAGAGPRRRRTSRTKSCGSASARTRCCSSSGGIVLSSRLIDGQFPNYRQLLPETFEHELRIAGAELTEVVRRISLLAQKNAPASAVVQPGRADDLRADARHRRGARVDAGGVPGRAARDRLQPRVPARRARGDRGGRCADEADQPAASWV